MEFVNPPIPHRLVNDDNRAPGFVSEEGKGLSYEEIDSVLNGSSNGAKIFPEKSLAGKGTRSLVLLDNNTLVEYAGVRKATFVTNGLLRWLLRRRFNRMMMI